MSAPAHDTSLLDVPGFAAQLKREWPRVAIRAALVVLFPLFTTLLIDSFGLVNQLSGIVPLISFLGPGGSGYPERVVAFIVGILVLGSFVLRQRTGAALLTLATGIVLAVAFNHSRLHWTKLFNFGEYAPEAPGASAWVWATSLLATVALFILAEETIDTRRHQTERGLPPDEVAPLARVTRQGVLIAIVAGAALVGALLGLGALLNPLVAEQSMFPRLNPVAVLFVLGIVLVVAVVLSARRAKVAVNEPTPHTLAPPTLPPGVRRVDTREPPPPPPSR